MLGFVTHFMWLVIYPKFESANSSFKAKIMQPQTSKTSIGFAFSKILSER